MARRPRRSRRGAGAQLPRRSGSGCRDEGAGLGRPVRPPRWSGVLDRLAALPADRGGVCRLLLPSPARDSGATLHRRSVVFAVEHLLLVGTIGFDHRPPRSSACGCVRLGGGARVSLPALVRTVLLLPGRPGADLGPRRPRAARQGRRHRGHPGHLSTATAGPRPYGALEGPRRRAAGVLSRAGQRPRIALRSTRARVGSTPCGTGGRMPPRALSRLLTADDLVLGEHGLHPRQRAARPCARTRHLALALADAQSVTGTPGATRVTFLRSASASRVARGGGTLADQHDTGAAEGAEHHRGVELMSPARWRLDGDRLLLVVPAACAATERAAPAAPGCPSIGRYAALSARRLMHERRGQGAERDADDQDVEPVARPGSRRRP